MKASTKNTVTFDTINKAAKAFGDKKKQLNVQLNNLVAAHLVGSVDSEIRAVISQIQVDDKGAQLAPLKERLSILDTEDRKACSVIYMVLSTPAKHCQKVWDWKEANAKRKTAPTLNGLAKALRDFEKEAAEPECEREVDASIAGTPKTPAETALGMAKTLAAYIKKNRKDINRDQLEEIEAAFFDYS